MKTALTLAAALWATAAAAEFPEQVAALDVLPGWQDADGTQMAGLRITLAPGWKTYWRAPGDAGIPPALTLEGADNIGSVQMSWPVPEVFDQNGMRSIGYHDMVVLPLRISPLDPGAPMHLSGRLEIGVCEEVCVPMEFGLDAMLPPAGKRDPAIVAALVDRPLTAQEAGVVSATCVLRPGDRGMEVTATITMPSAGGREVVVIEAGDPEIWVSEPDVTRSGNRLVAVSDLVHFTQDSFAVDRSAMRFTVLGNAQAVDIRGCAAG